MTAPDDLHADPRGFAEALAPVLKAGDDDDPVPRVAPVIADALDPIREALDALAARLEILEGR